ncbi:hypothetical protein D3C72_450890 [compost metagenome]
MTQLPNYTTQEGIPSNVKKQVSAEIYPPAGQRIQQRQNQNIMNEVAQHEKLRQSAANGSKASMEEPDPAMSYSLPSLSNKEGTEYYRNVYEKMLSLNIDGYSVKEVNFDIENAYFGNRLDMAEFSKIIKQTADFISVKMKERNFDMNSNTAKNFMLFEFFTQPMQVRGFKEKHFPIKYDFEDYWGRDDWAKMFVTKLLKTNTGQCHSMPLLYLMLAEEIDAKAYLALSPNHSYIRFEDDKGKWYNLELTNGMFTVPSFILNNGFITAEAIQNKLYMQNLSKKEMLSQFYTDLASGYVHKFGYDDFVEKVANKALELDPKSINANMVKSNYNEARLRYAIMKLGINTRTQQGREKILEYPKAVEILREMHAQYKVIDDSGFQQMPAEAYEKWLGSLREAEKKEESEKLVKQFKGTVMKIKN